MARFRVIRHPFVDRDVARIARFLIEHTTPGSVAAKMAILDADMHARGENPWRGTRRDEISPGLHRCRLTLFAVDHGIAHEGVSACPQAVTRQMVANFIAGAAAANVFVHANGVDLCVVEVGVAGGPIDAPGLISRRIAEGARNSA